eukprot:337442-Chlamydomonas_euryale.AAC.1
MTGTSRTAQPTPRAPHLHVCRSRQHTHPNGEHMTRLPHATFKPPHLAPARLQRPGSTRTPAACTGGARVAAAGPEAGIGPRRARETARPGTRRPCAARPSVRAAPTSPPLP